MGVRVEESRGLNPHQTVRMDKWKAGRKPGFSGELEQYDQTADQGDEHNVAPDHPARVKQMTAIMEEAYRLHADRDNRSGERMTR